MEFTIHNQKFGIEIEFGGILRNTAKRIVAEHFGTSYTSYSENILDNQGRTWKVVKDGSVNSQGGESNELVSPPLKYEDMESLQELVRKLRRAGAKVDSSCGIHVHVDLQNYTAKSLKNLVKYYAKYEHMFYKACNVLPNRAGHFAKPLTSKHPQMIEKIGSAKSIQDIKELWYGYDKQGLNKYDDSRYAGLNLHNIWYKGWMSGTVEFRLFNSTLHAGEIRTYVILALAISAKALNAKSVNGRTNNIVGDEFLFPKILGGLGIFSTNEEMKNVYKHLTKNMRTA